MFAVPMSRSITPLADLRALGRLYRVMRRFRPGLVNASTPKAGLLGTLAASMARVPVRVFTLRGLRMETAVGLRRRLLAATDRLSVKFADAVICVSSSLEAKYLEYRVGQPAKVSVLADGSSNGVDVQRFCPATDGHETERRRTRRDLGIPEDAPVVGFVGRLTRDKGVGDLVEAFVEGLAGTHSEARLLLIGDHETEDRLSDRVMGLIETHGRIVHPGSVVDTAPALRAMDVIAFPSYREGMPNVPLEAAACGLPVVGYRATGTVDAVVDGETGMLVDAGDTEALCEALGRYLNDSGLRRRHGASARRRVVSLFRSERVWDALVREHHRLLGQSGG